MIQAMLFFKCERGLAGMTRKGALPCAPLHSEKFDKAIERRALQVRKRRPPTSLHHRLSIDRLLVLR
jgi:hypothetical protein